jgi:hypothetical protein
VGNFNSWAFVSWGYLTFFLATALLVVALRSWPAGTATDGNGETA